MRQKLIYILKHNAVLQLLYRIIMSFAFRVWGAITPIDNNLVLFVSFMGMGFNDSPKAIYDYMQIHDNYKQYKCIWAFENPNKFSNINTVKIDTLAYFKTALKAKYWITNTNIERGLRFKKKKQVYLNTWHGIALKHIGNDVEGRKDFNFDTVNHLVVSGDHDEKVWKSAFKANPSTFLRCGMPRNEELWLADDEKKINIRKKLGIPIDKTVILYAPTWRDSANGGKSYDIKPPIHFDYWKETLKGEYLVLFRAHHQTTKVLGVQFDEFVRDVSNYSAVNDLMIASDMLITDYSAIAFDYSILCKPIFIYAYDYDDYLVNRGTYFNIDDRYPNKSCRTEDELLDRICYLNYEEECVNTRNFRDEFIKYGLGATEECVKAEFGE